MIVIAVILVLSRHLPALYKDLLMNHSAHIDLYHTQRILTEAKRVSRTLRGTELTEAKARSKRLTMAQMGISSTNLVFDSELLSSHLSDEIIQILKDDPETDTGIMHTRVPTDAQTSTIGESDQGGMRTLETDQDDDDQFSFITGFELNQLAHMASGSIRVIDRLPLFIHDLQRWSNGFDPIKFKRAEALAHKAFTGTYVPSTSLTKRGKVTTRRLRQPRRVPRKQARSTGLQA